MKLPRRATISQGAYAVLCEWRKGERWHTPQRREDGMVEIVIAGEQYDKLLQKREELHVATISDVILTLYKRGGAQS